MQADGAARHGPARPARGARLPPRWLRWLRRRLLPVGPYHVFAASGGSGSSHLASRLGAFVRPDVWQPPFCGRPLEEWRGLTREPGALLDGQGYAATAHDWEPFHRRTDGVFEGRIDPDRSIGENLAHFCRWLEGTDYRVVLVHAAILGLFSAHGIRRVTFLVRHPLHSLVSFAKSERHGAEIDALGGLESDKTIELWADRWNRFVSEYLACRRQQLDPVLIRFEFARRDAAVSDVHPRLFAGFETSRRNTDRLSRDREARLHALVAGAYAEVYDDWRI